MIDAIAEYEKHGGVRAAARANNIPYTTFRKIFAKQGGKSTPFFIAPQTTTAAKILVWDVETSPIDIMCRTYDLKISQKYFSPDDIAQDWTMISAAWKYVGKDRIYCQSVSSRDPRNDEALIRALHPILNDADILIGHNMDAFDLKKFNTRAIYYGLPAVQQKPTIDTLKVARKYFKFTSNKLSYLAEFLGVGAKGESPDWELLLAGDTEELAKCRDYNRQDVGVTEAVYLKMRSSMYRHPDLNLFNDFPVYLCPKCGSHDTIHYGHYYGYNTKRQRYACKSCGCNFSESSLMRRRENVKRV